MAGRSAAMHRWSMRMAEALHTGEHRATSCAADRSGKGRSLARLLAFTAALGVAGGCKKPQAPTPDEARLAIASVVRPPLARCTLAFADPLPQMQVLVLDGDDPAKMVCFDGAKDDSSAGAKCLAAMKQDNLAVPVAEAPGCVRADSGRLSLAKSEGTEPLINRLETRCQLEKIVVDHAELASDDSASVAYHMEAPDGFAEGLAPCGSITIAPTAASATLARADTGRWAVK